MVQQFGSHLHIELQQRGVEFTQLFNSHAHLRPALLERMPPMEAIRRDNGSQQQQTQHNAVNGMMEVADLNTDDSTVNSDSVCFIIKISFLLNVSCSQFYSPNLYFMFCNRMLSLFFLVEMIQVELTQSVNNLILSLQYLSLLPLTIKIYLIYLVVCFYII